MTRAWPPSGVFQADGAVIDATDAVRQLARRFAVRKIAARRQYPREPSGASHKPCGGAHGPRVRQASLGRRTTTVLLVGASTAPTPSRLSRIYLEWAALACALATYHSAPAQGLPAPRSRSRTLSGWASLRVLGSGRRELHSGFNGRARGANRRARDDRRALRSLVPNPN